MPEKSGMDRREFLEFMGRGSLALALSGGIAGGLFEACTASRPGEDTEGAAILAGKPFRALRPSAEDALRLSAGLSFRRVVTWEDELVSGGARFGFNNDFLAFFPLDGKTNEGILCANNETPNPLFVSGYTDVRETKTKEQVEREMDCTGVSIVHIRETAPGHWEAVKDSKYNRLVNGRTAIPIRAERPLEGGLTAIGTLGNCAGGKTPWGTLLTCEENYDQFYGEVLFRPNGKRTRVTREPKHPRESFGWYKQFPYPPEHYGWVVEIDPRTGKAEKHTALGRFAHEAATCARTKDGRVVVYSGDDTVNQHLYKFISAEKDSLDRGTLYVANTEEGRWIPLVRSKNPKLRKAFRDQTELLVRTREAAHLVGATPLDRAEDVEIDPHTGAVLVACTNNVERGNLYGSILKIEEEGGDHGALTFRASTFLSGGPGTGVACPDNMAFDAKGNLWITNDVGGGALNKAPYTEFKNNGLFFVPMSGPRAGTPFLVGTAPVAAEFTGPTFSPDGRTLFLSVQHPGETTDDLAHPTSHWPEGGSALPRPAVVAISGPLLDAIVGERV